MGKGKLEGRAGFGVGLSLLWTFCVLCDMKTKVTVVTPLLSFALKSNYPLGLLLSVLIPMFVTNKIVPRQPINFFFLFQVVNLKILSNL